MRWLRTFLVVGLVLSGVNFVSAEAVDDHQLAQATVDKALAYLKSKQKPDNGWQDEADPPGITALVLRAFISDDQFPKDQPFLQKGFEKLLSYQVQNGGIYKDVLACYNTAIAISALAESKDPAYQAR